jgi:phospholipid transport system substrate-binding protein
MADHVIDSRSFRLERALLMHKISGSYPLARLTGMARRCRGDLPPMDLLNFQECRSSAPLVGRRIVLCVALCWVVAALGSHHSSGASTTTAPIEQLYAALQTVMKAGKMAPFRQRYDTLAPVIARTFDLDGILESSVGPRWATLPPDQQSALKNAFRRYTIAIYVTNFDSFSGQRFEVQPSSVPAGEDQIVQTRIIPASGEAHRLDYVMRQVGGTWKVVDVLADGSISRVAVQRSEMRTPLANGGGPALLDRLQKKTAEMSGGQPLP